MRAATLRTLSVSDWRLLAAAALAQMIAAAGVRLLPLHRARAAARRLRPLTAPAFRGSDARIIWAIEATGRRLGRVSNCLVRAVVAETALAGRGEPTTLTIGIRRNAAGGIDGHAWLHRQGRVLIGGTGDGYVALAAWDAAE